MIKLTKVSGIHINQEKVARGPFISKFVTLKGGIKLSCRAWSVYEMKASPGNYAGYGFCPKSHWKARVVVTVWNDHKKIEKRVPFDNTWYGHHCDDPVREQRLTKRKDILKLAKKMLKEFRNP